MREKDPTGQASRCLSSHGEEACASAFAKIIDRTGLQVELVPTLFSATQGMFPTGQRGVFAWWRTGCTAIGTGSAAGCALRYVEVK